MTVVINGRFLQNSFGGVRRYATELTTRLAALRDDVVLVTPPLPAGVAVPEAPTLEIGRLGGALWEQIELPRWLRSQGSPLLVNLANIAPLTYRRQLCTLHDIAPVLRPQDFTLLFRAQWLLAVRYGMSRRGQRIVTISDASRHEIAERFRIDPSRIERIYIGADGLAGAAGETQGDPGRTVPSTFVVFGRHGAGKNVRIVIDALRELSPTARGGPGPARVDFVGALDPALQPYARERMIDPEAITWSGEVSDAELSARLNGAVGFIWPSLHEGFGLPPVEAQRQGTPVIAADVRVNREILGDSAVYFPGDDASALAAAMAQLIEDDRLRAPLVERGRRNAARFTWDAAAAEWNALIEADTQGESTW